jgi:hypothetical protein
MTPTQYVLYIETPQHESKGATLYFSLSLLHMSIHIPCSCPVELRDSKNQIKTTIPLKRKRKKVKNLKKERRNSCLYYISHVYTKHVGKNKCYKFILAVFFCLIVANPPTHLSGSSMQSTWVPSGIGTGLSKGLPIEK